MMLLGPAFTLSAAPNKLDPALMLMKQKGPSGLNRDQGIMKSTPDGREPLVRTIVRFEGLLSGVESAGGKIRSVIGDIATVDVPLSAIDRMAQLPGVVYIEAARKVRRQLDASVPETGAGGLRSGVPPQWTGSTGRNVVIGIVDTGIDLTHSDFKDSAGQTRVLSLWDQTAPSGTPPPGRAYGNECTKAIIDAGTCPKRGEDWHGTHVAGAAAGNGSATGNGQAAFRYIGMAPEADLVVVQTDDSDAGVLDGIAYIQEKAAALGKPSVVNLSLGGDLGSHDGTLNYERGLDQATGAGKVIVIAAGNAGASHTHASGTLAPSGSANVGFSIPSALTDTALDFWYAGADQMAVSVTHSQNPLCTAKVSAGEMVSLETPCGLVEIFSSEVLPVNGDREILILLRNLQPVATGPWTVTLTGARISNGRFDGWIFSGGQASEFTTHRDPRITLNTSATAGKLISVGAYTTKNAWTTSPGGPQNSTEIVGDISSFSGRGPRRSCSDLSKCPLIQKPELAAPGSLVISALSSTWLLFNPTRRDPDFVHVGLEGTSLSTPHVSGAVALMLQAAPTLTSDEIKSILTANTRVDSFTGAVPNDDWGFGKLDVQAAFADTPNPPPAAPTGFSSIIGEGAASLSWNANRELDLDGYHLYRSTTSGTGYVKVATLSYRATSFTDAGLTNGTPYFYLLRAVDTKGQESQDPVSSLSEGGGGCAIGPKADFDPMPAGLLGFSLALLGWRRIRPSRR